MTASVLPPSPAGFAKATWEDVVPFDDLLERPLDAACSGLAARVVAAGELVTEAAALAMIATRSTPSDSGEGEDHLRFSTEILPEDGGAERGAGAAVRGAGTQRARPGHDADAVPHLHRDLPRGERAHLLRAGELSARYQRITGSMTVEWEASSAPSRSSSRSSRALTGR